MGMSQRCAHAICAVQYHKESVNTFLLNIACQFVPGDLVSIRCQKESAWMNQRMLYVMLFLANLRPFSAHCIYGIKLNLSTKFANWF